MLPPLCSLRESEGRVLRPQMMAQSPDRNAAREDGRRRKWPPQELASDDIETQRQLVRYVVTAKLHNACLYLTR
jgi:hypothetical protein